MIYRFFEPVEQQLLLRCHENGGHFVDGDGFPNAAAEAKDQEPAECQLRSSRFLMADPGHAGSNRYRQYPKESSLAKCFPSQRRSITGKCKVTPPKSLSPHPLRDGFSTQHNNKKGFIEMLVMDPWITHVRTA